MNIDIDYSFQISLFDFGILGLLIWGTYKGYIKGAVFQSVSLFALLIGFTLAVVICKPVYSYLANRSDIPDLFTIIFFGFLFAGAIYGAAWVSDKILINAKDLPKDTTSKTIGALCGFVKILLIVAVYVILAFKIDQYANYLPDREKRSKVSHVTIYILSKTVQQPFFQVQAVKVYKPKSNNDKKKKATTEE